MNDIQAANYSAPNSQAADYQAAYQAETSLSDVARALWRRKWIILLVTPVFIVAAYFVTQRMPKQWQAQAQLVMIQRPEVGSMGAPDAAYVAPASGSMETQLGLLQTSTMAERAVSWLKNQELTTGQPADADTVSPGELQHSLAVSNPKESELIDIAVLSSSRDKALLLANAVAQSFVQWKKEQARKDVQATEITLVARTADARKKMEATRLKQLAYQKNHDIVDSGTQARIGIQRLTTRTEAVADIQQELDTQQAYANSLASQLKLANASIQKTGGRDDALIASLNSQLSQLQIARDDLAQRVTPAYPGKLPLLDKQIADIKTRLQAAVGATQNNSNATLQSQGMLQQNLLSAQTQLAATQAKLANAQALENQAQQAMTPLVQTGSTFDQIAQNAQEAATYYSGLRTALVSARLRENQINGDFQITQSAVAPDAPSKPSLTLNLLVGTLLGLLVSLLSVFIVEQVDRRVRTEDQVERLGSGPILGALPRLSRSALALLDRRQTPVPIAESYSLAGANLQRVLGAPLPGQGRLVMVTSAQAGEGKSLTAAELARSLARSGKRVILVDADMRHPALSSLFEDVPEDGLVEVLSGKALLDDALTATETPNLSVLFNHAPRTNSADIIVSPHMTNFLQMVRNRADIVVLDTPSCTFVDPLLLAPSVDYVLQVIDLGRSNEDAVGSTSGVLSGLAPLGLFINRTSKKNAPAYEVARSFASTLTRPGLPGEGSPFSADHTLMMFRNTPGYTATHLNGTLDPLADEGQAAHDLTIPLKREDH